MTLSPEGNPLYGCRIMGVWGYEWHDKPMRNKAVTRATFDPFAFRVISKPCLHHDVLYHRLGR
jgi:hypothetical protein